MWSTSLVSLIKVNEEAKGPSAPPLLQVGSCSVSFLRPGRVSGSESCSWHGWSEISQRDAPRTFLCVALCSAQEAVQVFMGRTVCVGDSMEHERNETNSLPQSAFCAVERKLFLRIRPLPHTVCLIKANHLVPLTLVSLPEKRR